MKAIRGYLGLAAAAGLLAACGGGGESSGDDAAAADSGSETSAESTDTASAAAPAEDAPSADSTDTLDGTTFAEFTGDAAKGEQVFLQCKSCHVLEEGQNRIGPSLAGIVGRAAGTVEGYDYTPANANSGITWTPEKMYQYLENPQRVIPGTKMAFAGLPQGQDRADIIAYLSSAGS